MNFTHYAASVLLLASVGAGTSSAQPSYERGEALVLVLGDSVPFAYINSAGYEYINPQNFIGFADDLGSLLDLRSIDLACPGETTGSFISTTAPDNGCRGYRAEFPLHVGYHGTQLAYAKWFLQRHPHVRLVTVTLGANDGFLLEASCASAPDPQECIEAGVPALLESVGQNLQMILADLRGTGYGGAIVVMNYYSVDYSDPAGTGLTQLLNGALAAPATAYGAVVADVFTAFQTVATNAPFGGKTCNAGLLNASAANPLLCDVHPSQSGHDLIAKTIAEAYRDLNR
jgi:lysophospholipase L1-like esterase